MDSAYKETPVSSIKDMGFLCLGDRVQLEGNFILELISGCSSKKQANIPSNSGMAFPYGSLSGPPDNIPFACYPVRNL